MNNKFYINRYLRYSVPNLKCPICGRRVKFLSDHIARFHPEDDLLSNKKSKKKYDLTNTAKKHNEASKNDKKFTKGIMIIDGMNIANYGAKSKPSYLNIYITYKTLKNIGYLSKIIVSSALKYKIDDPIRLNKMISRNIVIQAPSGEDDDLTIIEYALRYNAKVITNDRFLNHPEATNIERIRFNITGRSIFFDPPLF